MGNKILSLFLISILLLWEDHMINKNNKLKHAGERVSEFGIKLLFKKIGGPQKGYNWFFLCLAFFCILSIAFLVDLSPKVESDFFFSTDDPQLQVSNKISTLFPSKPQIIISVSGDDIFSTDFIKKIDEITQSLISIEGVKGVYSLTKGPNRPSFVPRSELWKRLLLSKDQKTTNIIVSLDKNDANLCVAPVNNVVAKFNASDFKIEISGLPYVVELIRDHLLRDLKIFSIVSFFIFGIVAAIVFRSMPIVIGTLSSCLVSCTMTLCILNICNIPIGILTANIATIVFVLTLSHIVFLTSNWQRYAGKTSLKNEDFVDKAVRETFTASFWCMVTTFCGFLSLLFASAKPLRELGTAGAIGTVLSILTAYAFYPAFMRTRFHKKLKQKKKQKKISENFYRLRFGLVAGIIILLSFIAALGLKKLETDPGLLSFFKKGSEIRNGLEAVDKSSGSSPLQIVVRDKNGCNLDDGKGYDKLVRLQETLEKDDATRMVLSLPVIIAEGELEPISIMLTRQQLIDELSSPKFNNIIADFVTNDRKLSVFSLWMPESDRNTSREKIIERIKEHVHKALLIPELVGGLYVLQSELSKLVVLSLITGLGGLFALFAFIAALVSCSMRITFIMVASLIMVPIFVLGMMGHLNMPVDIISSPAANVAIAIGVDSMIHLVMRIRRLKAEQNIDDSWKIWLQAASELWKPIWGATFIICAGFGIFSFSSFPPTQRFGLAVLLGSAFAGLVSTFLVPYVACLKKKHYKIRGN